MSPPASPCGLFSLLPLFVAAVGECWWGLMKFWRSTKECAGNSYGSFRTTVCQFSCTGRRKGSVLLGLWERYVAGFLLLFLYFLLYGGFASRDVGWGEWLTCDHDSCCPCRLGRRTFFPRVVVQGSRLGYRTQCLITLQSGLG